MRIRNAPSGPFVEVGGDERCQGPYLLTDSYVGPNGTETVLIPLADIVAPAELEPGVPYPAGWRRLRVTFTQIRYDTAAVNELVGGAYFAAGSGVPAPVLQFEGSLTTNLTMWPAPTALSVLGLVVGTDYRIQFTYANPDPLGLAYCTLCWGPLIHPPLPS